jgi:hypothetical protein
MRALISPTRTVASHKRSVALFFERKVTGMQKDDACSGNISPERLGARRRKEWVVLSLDGE